MRRLLALPAVLVAVALSARRPRSGTPRTSARRRAPGQRLESSPGRVVARVHRAAQRQPGRRDAAPVGRRAGRARLRSRVEGRKRLVITPASELGTGSYRVDWHTVSTEDGHALEGAFAFGVRAAAGAAPAVETGPLKRGGARIAARIALYTTVLVLAALLLLPLLVKRPRGWPVPDLRLPERPAAGSAPPGGGGVATLAAPRRGAAGARLHRDRARAGRPPAGRLRVGGGGRGRVGDRRRRRRGRGRARPRAPGRLPDAAASPAPGGSCSSSSLVATGAAARAPPPGRRGGLGARARRDRRVRPRRLGRAARAEHPQRLAAPRLRPRCGSAARRCSCCCGGRWCASRGRPCADAVAREVRGAVRAGRRRARSRSSWPPASCR